MFVPLQELENPVPGSWYINVLATYPEYRGQGIGGELVALAEKIAASSGHELVSIIVSDANEGARRLYERCGYREIATRPMVKEDWQSDADAWVLTTKEI